jgi:hypothetical protein
MGRPCFKIIKSDSVEFLPGQSVISRELQAFARKGRYIYQRKTKKNIQVLKSISLKVIVEAINYD